MATNYIEGEIPPETFTLVRTNEHRHPEDGEYYTFTHPAGSERVWAGRTYGPFQFDADTEHVDKWGPEAQYTIYRLLGAK